MGLAFRGRQCLACPHANSRAKRSMCRYSIEVQINSCHTKWCHAEMFKIVHFQQKTAFYSQKNSPLDALVRMRSPVRIWVAAPKIPENFGFWGFFIAKNCFVVWLQFFDPHRDPHTEMIQRTQECRAGRWTSCPAQFSFCLYRNCSMKLPMVAAASSCFCRVAWV